ncbi:hypothetical protein B0H67DRAFT_650685, partial [Lasiosphaeris hirsuta]
HPRDKIATYDHRYWRTRDPVRSPIDKPVTARLVVGSLTTSEPLVLYVLFGVSRPIFFCYFQLLVSEARRSAAKTPEGTTSPQAGISNPRTAQKLQK